MKPGTFLNPLRIGFTLIMSVVLLICCSDEETPTAPSIDYLAPTVEWVSPESGSELTGSVDLTFTAYDENAVDLVRLYINGSIVGWGGHSCLPEECNITILDDTTFSLTWNTLEEEDGVYIEDASASGSTTTR